MGACLDPETVIAWLDGELPPERTAAIEAHLDECDACRRVVSESAAAAVDASELPTAVEVPRTGAALSGKLGPYQIRGVIGRGGMGVVYRAYDPRLQREVAIKIVKSAAGERLSSDDLAWFEREARAAAAINHVNVLAVYDVGEHEGAPYVVTELLDGETLRSRLRRGALVARQAVGIAANLAHGVAAAHERGVVHRDLKPENVFITSGGRVVILDFGVARFYRGTPAGDGVRDRGLVVGTLGYMAPEQVRAEEVDHRADIFALGAVLFEMLAGKPAFPGATDVDRAEAALGEDPFERDPDAFHHVPFPIVQIMRRCLEKDPAGRFASARDLAFVLDTLGADSMRVPRPVRRRAWWPIALVGGAAVAAAGIAVLVAVALRRTDAPPELPVARQMLDGVQPVTAARYGPGGDVFYNVITADDGSRYGGRVRLFVRAPNGTPGVIGDAGTRLAAVARDGRVAAIVADGDPYEAPRGRLVVFAPKPGEPGGWAATAPARDADDVAAATFLPDGALAIIRARGGLHLVEAPIGHVRYQSQLALSSLAAAGDGALAFVEHTPGEAPAARVLHLAGDRPPRRVGEWRAVTGLAWDRDTLVVSGARGPLVSAVWRLDGAAGEGRVAWTSRLGATIQDVDARGSLLVIDIAKGRAVRVHRLGWPYPRSFSIGTDSYLDDLSLDGSLIAVVDRGGEHVRSVLRTVDGDTAISLGDRADVDISPDRRRVLSRTMAPPWRVVITEVPDPSSWPRTPAEIDAWDRSRSRTLSNLDITAIAALSWANNGTNIAFLDRAAEGMVLRVQHADDLATQGLRTPWPGFVDAHNLEPYMVAFSEGLRAGDSPAKRNAEVALTWATQHGDLVLAGWDPDLAHVYAFDPDAWPPVIEKRAIATNTVVETIPIPVVARGQRVVNAAIATDGKTLAFTTTYRDAQIYRVDGDFR